MPILSILQRADREIRARQRPVALVYLAAPRPTPLREALSRTQGIAQSPQAMRADRAAVSRSKSMRGIDRPQFAKRPARAFIAPIIASAQAVAGSRSSRHPRKNPAGRGHPLHLGHWPCLIRFLNDGTPRDGLQPVENQISRLPLTRKNGNSSAGNMRSEPKTGRCSPRWSSPAKWPT